MSRPSFTVSLGADGARGAFGASRPNEIALRDRGRHRWPGRRVILREPIPGWRNWQRGGLLIRRLRVRLSPPEQNQIATWFLDNAGSGLTLAVPY